MRCQYTLPLENIGNATYGGSSFIGIGEAIAWALLTSHIKKWQRTALTLPPPVCTAERTRTDLN